MRRTTAALVFALLLVSESTTAFTFWNETRASALLPDQTVVLRTENPDGAGITNSVLYHDGGVQERVLSPVEDGPATLEGFPPGPVDGARGYGFRLIRPGEIDVLAVRIPNESSPSKDDHSLLTTDPVGDEAFGQSFLDLTEIRLTRDDNRLYASFTNNGGGFPVSSGLTFYSYLLGINNPESSASDTVFGMIHTVSVAGIIEPGLYQINGTGVDDLDKIGEITATEHPADNTLVLSCLLADLEANEVFQSWYDTADPRIDVAGFTQKISLFGGTEEADQTEGGVWHLREVQRIGGTNQLPQLSDLSLPDPGSGAFVSVIFDDADTHCPVYAELVLDGTQVYPLFPQNLDYSGPVEYRSNIGIPALEAGTWSVALVRFSDNQTDEVTLAGGAAAVNDAWSDPVMFAFPNPFSGPTQLSFSLNKAQQVQLSIYNLAGRRVRTLVNSQLSEGNHFRGWDGRDGQGRPQPAGVYFFMLKTPDGKKISQMTLIR